MYSVSEVATTNRSGVSSVITNNMPGSNPAPSASVLIAARVVNTTSAVPPPPPPDEAKTMSV